MKLLLSDKSPEPLQAQICSQITALVLSGEIITGFMLPSIRGLARELRVSVITVQRAYEQLERDGLIYSRRGKGYYIADISDKDKTGRTLDIFRQALSPAIETALEQGADLEELKTEINNILDKLSGGNNA